MKMEDVFNKLPNVDKWENIKKIEAGFDDCVKYYFEYLGKRYIIKIFDEKSYEKKLKEYCILQKVQDLSFKKPLPIQMEKVDEKYFFYILSWVDGITLTQYSKGKKDVEMYDIGIKIGKIMEELHKEQFDYKDLSSKILKIKNKIPLFKKLDFNDSEIVIKYLENNVDKLYRQPKSIVHGDLNQDNIIIDENGEIGIIDFGNSDIDYSYQDTHQIQMYNRFLNIPLCQGILDEYSKNKDEKVFWESYKIYSAYYCLSKIVWANKFNEESLLMEMIRRAKQTVKDFENFKSDKPVWYLERNIEFQTREEI